MQREQAEYQGEPGIRVGNDAVAVIAATGFGPRVVSLVAGGVEFLATLPGVTLDGPDGRPYHLRGGHRLWRAPERVATTYLPDDAPVYIEEIPSGIRMIQSVECDTGIEKTIAVSVPGDDAVVVVDHLMVNHGPVPVPLAPWAITQLVTGGHAVLPLGNATGLQANRNLVLWPYTRLDDPGVTLRDDAAVISGTRTDPIKFGTSLDRGWLAYRLGGMVFVKRSRHRPGASYADLGASGQVYVNDRFVELETLGPLETIASGDGVRHREVWELHRLDPGGERSDDLPAGLDLDTPAPWSGGFA